MSSTNLDPLCDPSARSWIALFAQFPQQGCGIVFASSPALFQVGDERVQDAGPSMVMPSLGRRLGREGVPDSTP